MLIILQSRLQEIALVVRRLFASFGGTNEIVDSQLSIPSPSLVFWRRPSTLSNLLRLLSRKPFWNLIPAAESSPLPRSWVTRSSLGRAPASFVPARATSGPRLRRPPDFELWPAPRPRAFLGTDSPIGQTRRSLLLCSLSRVRSLHLQSARSMLQPPYNSVAWFPLSYFRIPCASLK